MEIIGVDKFIISIRAPARGATDRTLNNVLRVLFQSALPRGERRRSLQESMDCAYFNPRSREGSDISGNQHHARTYNFNPRSREGSDGMPPGSEYIILNFNPRSREGSDTGYARGAAATVDFNPRSREGSDYKSIIRRRFRMDFNPRSREGSDTTITAASVYWTISIRAPARGATSIFTKKFSFFLAKIV